MTAVDGVAEEVRAIRAQVADIEARARAIRARIADIEARAMAIDAPARDVLTLSVTREEAAAIQDALGWAVTNIRDFLHVDEGKPARVATAIRVERSVRAKIKAAS